MRIQIPFVLFLFVLTHCGLSQAVLTFEEEAFNFEEIEEVDIAEHTFRFVNTGDRPIKITNVKASCGCTTPGWTKEEIMPGDSGYVQVRYNPKNRPGKFRKSLHLSTTEPTQNKVLYISGFVKPQLLSIEEELPVTAGSLRIKYRSLNLGKVTTEKTVLKSFDVYNRGGDSIRLQHHLMRIPAHIKLSMKPEILAPKRKGKLIIEYDPVAKDDLGFISDNITIQVDTVVKERNEFYVIATLEEYFPEMSAEELDRAPKLTINKRIHNFGQVIAGKMITVEFELSNTGKENLNFRKVKSNCSCVTYELPSKNLKKGKIQTLRISFDTTGRRGNQHKTVVVFSNDPIAPIQMITLKGIVDM